MVDDAGSYDFPVDPDNLNTTYGLICHRVPTGSQVLDIGCASGNLALALERVRGCTVLGVDADRDAVAAAQAKGVMAICADVSSDRLDELLQGRQFDVVILADVLEHLVRPVDLLVKARSFLRPSGRALVSFPNITHIDVQLMLAQDQWRYMHAGILDQTHLRFFTLASFSELAVSAGYEVTGRERVTLASLQTEVLDQGRGLQLAAAEVTRLEELNRRNTNSHVYQYVLELRPAGPAILAQPPAQTEAVHSAPPHLDVIVRTIEGRLEFLKEALYSLAAVAEAHVHPIVVVHGPSAAHLERVQELVAHLEGLLPEVTVRSVTDGEGIRSRPLNVGLDLADGEYLAFLDDDDVVYPTFAQRLIGALRAEPALSVAYGQSQVVHGEVTEDGFRALRHGRRYASPFDRVRLFLENYIPINSYVARTAEVRSAAARFDESLPLLEDWAFLCQLAARAPFLYVPHVVSEYRMRADGSNATAAVGEPDWEAARTAVERGVAGQPIRVSGAELAAVARGRQALQLDVQAARATLDQVLRSRSWKITRPLRRLMGSRLPE